jgi:glutamate 5-kinase
VTRLVIKLGSSSIASGDGLALDVIAALVNQIATVQRDGHEILLVTSGAARLGRRLLAFEGPTAGAAPALRALVGSVTSLLPDTPDSAAKSVRREAAATVSAADIARDEHDRLDIARADYDRLDIARDEHDRFDIARADYDRLVIARAEHDRLIGSLRTTLGRYDGSDSLPRAVGMALPASVGQPALMALYRQLAAAVGVEVCQILVSKSDLDSARAMSDLGDLLRTAVGRGLLPIINGNDTTDPMSALDNDQIAVAVAVAAQASRLLFLTDVRAAYRDSSWQDRIARLTPDEARSVRVLAPGAGRGGMGSKLSAAARAASCGIECVIGSAREPAVVARSINPRARMGTVVRATRTRLEPSQRWIGGMAYSAGSICINRDAELSLRAGSTLFLSGVKRVDGEFEPGAVVELVDVRHPERLIGRGSVALPAGILRLLRALAPGEVTSAISILFRLRHSLTAPGAGSRGRSTIRSQLVAPDEFQDCRELIKSNSKAARQALEQLSGSSPEGITELTNSLMLAQPQLCAAVLLDGSFRSGQVPTEPAARRAARNIHAVHRDSLVVYSDD